jgi:hypothetical protein
MKCAGLNFSLKKILRLAFTQAIVNLALASTFATLHLPSSLLASAAAFSPSTQSASYSPSSSSSPAPQNRPVAILHVDSAETACGILANPADIILQAGSLFDQHQLGDQLLRLVKLKEILSFSDTNIEYSHAEIITEISTDISSANLVSWSYYPPAFQQHLPPEQRKGPFIEFGHGEYPDYRTDFSVFRAKKPYWITLTKLRELTLRNIQYRSKDSVYGYRPLPDPLDSSRYVNAKVEFAMNFNSCSDFVAWAYERYFTAWWNRVPAIRHLAAYLYPPESFTTPDDLAKTPDTEKVCTIEGLRLTYPTEPTPTSTLITAIRESLQSSNDSIRSHAKWVRSVLVREGIISSDDQILINSFRFEPR